MAISIFIIYMCFFINELLSLKYLCINPSFGGGVGGGQSQLIDLQNNMICYV